MDFSTTIYDSTAQHNYYPTTKLETSVSAEQLCALMNQLMSTLAIDEMSLGYYQHMTRLLPIASLNLRDFDNTLLFGRQASAESVCVELALPDCCQNNDSETRHAYYTFTRPLDGEQYGWLLQLHQLFSRQLSNALEYSRIRQMATKDMLTGLGNRNGFDEALMRLIGRCQRHHQPFALLIIDLDNFKAINDTLGHSEGDKVLISLANQIQQSLRQQDQAFRFGGDEFCCLMDCQTNEQLSAAANRLQSLVRDSAHLGKHNISCSLGGAIYREGDDFSALFDRADSALYQVKHSGKNNYHAA